MDIRPGSMGRPLPGVDAALLERGEDGRAEVARRHGGRDHEPDAEGELALRPGWPSMFRGYLRRRGALREAFAGGWYLTGDLARRDADGYFWFVGRADDVIKSAGHLIGPFEVESVLMEHPAVAEAGVIGKPDPVAGEIVKAFVALQARLRAQRGTAPRAARLRPAPARRGRRRRRSTSTRTCRTPAAARSCAACSRPASSACQRETCRPWRERHDAAAAPRRREHGRRAHRSELLREMLLHPAVRGAVRRAVQRRRDPRLPAPVHRRGGRRGRRDARR